MNQPRWPWAIVSLVAVCTALAQPAPSYNLALSAHVVTSDPARIKGTQAHRLHEFPTADLFLTKPVPATADGSYSVPTYGETGCIGLDWAERRVLTEVWLRAGVGQNVTIDGIRIQYWSSEGRKD